MGKYESLLTDIFSVFSKPAWKTENIKTYPSNYLATNAGNEFIRVSIIPRSQGINLISSSGVLIIDIFTVTGNGPKRSFVIADTLDEYLVGKTLKTTSSASVQFGSSTLSESKSDAENTALLRTTYTIPFNFFGVL